ncbi:MAG: phosphate propanoyltransferase [Exilispira sp.]
MKDTVIVNLSNRHIHLSQQDLEILFGKGYQLKKIKDLLQPGQYAADECVKLIGPKGEFPKVRILGPTRNKTQCEIMYSDAFVLGIEPPPVRESGDLNGSAPMVIEGPNGKLELKEGLIIAKRHIHLDPQTAEEMDLKDKQIVSVEVGVKERKTIYKDVVIRVKDTFLPECHLDFDEGSAASIKNGDIIKVIK